MDRSLSNVRDEDVGNYEEKDQSKIIKNNNEENLYITYNKNISLSNIKYSNFYIFILIT